MNKYCALTGVCGVHPEYQLLITLAIKYSASYSHDQVMSSLVL